MGLQRLPLNVAESGGVVGTDENAEFADRDCQDCDGDCRAILQRLQRLLGVPRMQIYPGLSRTPRLLPETAQITNFAGRKWVIACWDWKNRRHYRPRSSGLHRLQPKNAEIARVAGSAEFSVRDCRKSWPRLLRLQWRLPADIAETSEIAGSGENADISRIVEIVETVTRECRNCQFCRARNGDCMLRLKNLTMLPDGINGTAEIAN